MDDGEPGAEAVFALLAEPATHGGAAVKRIDTHAAAVFLAGTRAFKVKRAVRFPFLDYSTLAKRKAACEAEIEVNRPFAPDIYRGVVPITREPTARLALGGDGDAGRMGGRDAPFRRDMRRSTSWRRRAGSMLTLADALGRAVAAAHATAPAKPMPAAGSRRWPITSTSTSRPSAKRPSSFRRREVEALARASRAAYARIRPLLRERGRRGLVRRIHGDLHLGNIVLIDGRPVLFDAIEFSPLIASGDVLYDLAFLLMDLIERGLQAGRERRAQPLSADTGRAEDLDALAALPFFLSMRAAIRAKVTAARLRCRRRRTRRRHREGRAQIFRPCAGA